MPIADKVINEAVERYDRERDRYLKLASRVADLCRTAVVENNAIRAQVTSRTKTVQAGLTQSMSRKGECLDNAPMESFFASLKKELVHRRRFKTRAQAKAAIFEYIEVFYNRQRRHSAIEYQTPQQAFNNMTCKNGRIGSITELSGNRDEVQLTREFHSSDKGKH